MANKKNGASRLVLAAGAVLYREKKKSLEVALVHRKRYDDWSLPKGKCDAGESLPVTAVRELEEETGYPSTLQFRLGVTGYPLKEHSRKEVTYWAARAGKGDFVRNGEVDQLRWLSVSEAQDLVSYQLDRKLIKRFAQKTAVDSSVLLVRHAKAGNRSDWKDDDKLRPLEKDGRLQAEMLVPLLKAFGVRKVYTAPLVRCEQTVTPLADELGVKPITEKAVSDEYFLDSPKKAVRRLRALAEEATAPIAVCSQGDAIPGLVRALAADSDLDVGDAETKKGGVWYLGFSGDKLVHADLMPSPLPVR